MPVIPRRRVTNVQESQAPAIRAEANAPIQVFGGGETSNNLANTISSNLSKIAKKYKDESDQTIVNEKLIEYRTLKNHMLFDQEDGIAFQFGKNAVGKLEAGLSALTEASDEIGKDLLNKNQRDLFKKNAASEQESFRRIAQTHEIQQIHSYNKEVYNSTLESNKTDSIINYFDHEKLSDNTRITKETIEKEGERQGWSQEKINEEIIKQNGDVIYGVINKLLDNDQYEESKEVYNKYSDSLSVESNNKIIKSMSVAKIQYNSDLILQELITRAKNPNEAQKLLKSKEFQAEVKSELGIVSEQTYKIALNKFQKQYNYYTKLNQLEREKLFKNIKKMMAMPENKDKDVTEVIPPSELAALTPKQIAIILSEPYLSENESRNLNEDEAAYREFVTMSTRDIAEMPIEDLYEKYMYKTKDPEKKNQMEMLWEAYSSNDKKIITIHQRVKSYADENLKSKEDRASFIGKTKQDIEFIQKEEGRDLRGIEIKELMDQNLTGIDSPGFFGGKDPYWKIDKTDIDKEIKREYDFFDAKNLDEDEKKSLKDQIDDEVKKYIFNNYKQNEKTININLMKADYMNLAYGILTENLENNDELLNLKIEKMLKKKGL